MMQEEKQFNIKTIEHKLPNPFLKDVNYIDYQGNRKTIKGFIGSVKNIKAVNDNYIQPVKLPNGRFRNPQISLSTFFVDKNVIYGDYFHGTLFSKFTQLLPISQKEINPLFHKKQDIQFDIVSCNVIEAESGENQNIATRAKQLASKNYNIIDNNEQNNSREGCKPKLKCFSTNENVLETVFNKYLKFTSKAYNALFNANQFFKHKHSNISDVELNKTTSLNDLVLFNVYHDELLAVPKDKDLKTHFDCGIVIQTPNSLETIKQTLMIQAKCGYPYVIFYQDDNELNQANPQPYKPPKLQYKLMSNYISDLEDTYAKNIEQARDKLKKLDTKDFFYKLDKCACEQCITTYQSLIENIKTDQNIQQFLKYEKQQIDYIISKKSKSFNCSNKLLKQCMQKISKTDNKAEQLNYLINYENEIKEEVQQQKALAKKLKIEPEDLWHNQKHKKFNDMLQKIIINNTLGISVKEFNKILEEKFKAKNDEGKIKILSEKSKEIKKAIKEFKDFKYDPYGHMQKLEREYGQHRIQEFKDRKINDIYEDKTDFLKNIKNIKSKIDTKAPKRLKNTKTIVKANKKNR